MRYKLLNLSLIISSLFGYLEWGGGNHMFLFQGEADLVSKIFTNPYNILHPFVLLPIAGQLLLVVTLFQKQVSRLLSISGILLLSTLLLMIFAIGLFGWQTKILLSATPYVVLSTVAITVYLRKSS